VPAILSARVGAFPPNLSPSAFNTLILLATSGAKIPNFTNLSITAFNYSASIPAPSKVSFILAAIISKLLLVSLVAIYKSFNVLEIMLKP
jgi:hypothetical protein